MTTNLSAKRYFSLFLVFAFVGSSGFAENDLSQQKERLSSLLDQVRQEVGAPGAILGVCSSDARCAVVASGVADRESGRSMTPEIPYYLGSITKTYTAVTINRLVEKGRLSLDDTIDRFLPSFPDGNKIKIRHLLGHTSGLKDFFMYFYYRPKREEMIEMVTKRWSQAELLELAGRFGRWFEPGTDWDYSSTNYFLLGVIIEKTSGLSLQEAYRAYIYQPLGLKKTWLPQYEEHQESLPTGYMGYVESWKHSEMFGELGPTTILDRSSAEWSAGGLAAPAEESMRFLQGVIGAKLLSHASLDAMMQFRDTPPLGISDPKAPPENSDGYGLGLIRMKRSGFTLLGHGGMYNGHTAGVWNVAECNITIALYLNRGFVNQRSAIDRILPEVCKKQ